MSPGLNLQHIPSYIPAKTLYISSTGPPKPRCSPSLTWCQYEMGELCVVRPESLSQEGGLLGLVGSLHAQSHMSPSDPSVLGWVGYIMMKGHGFLLGNTLGTILDYKRVPCVQPYEYLSKANSDSSSYDIRT